ncbi:hypothetical protein NIA13_02100 [Oscillibacter valericigenes]|nr:hypothetical protein [Oscillibacter valericigenes]
MKKMKRVKKSLRAYQILSSAFTAAIVVAVVALLAVAGASDAGNLTDAELFKSLTAVSGGFAIAYLGKHICTKNIMALERRMDRYIERKGMVDTFTMQRKYHKQSENSAGAPHWEHWLLYTYFFQNGEMKNEHHEKKVQLRWCRALL